ncbi:MAG: hypothetical protein LAO08_08770 [Acidobacteriia bacterium]|nr:hypothetical protein [Terriglobia bacterium]
MRFATFVFVLALLSLSVSAQNKKNAPAQSSTSVLINGQPIKGKVLEVDGRHFVAVEDLAQSLRGTIAYGDGQIALTLPELPAVTAQAAPPQLPSASSQLPSTRVQPPSSQVPLVSAQPSGIGRIKGTITYFVDFHTGNKPDVGTKVWLVNGRVEIPADQTFVGTGTSVGTSANPERYPAIQYSIADENGNFEMRDVPAGEYTLIMQSAHTVGALNEKRNFFGRGNGHTLRDSKGRVEFLNVQVKPGGTVEASKDFGPNIDM